MGDERTALLGQQVQQPLLLRHQRIDFSRLALKVVGDSALLG